MIASCVGVHTRAASRQDSPQDAQTGCPGRPQRTKRRIVLVPYGEPLSDARTPLADCFRILLEPCPDSQPKQDPQRHQAELLDPIGKRME